MVSSYKEGTLIRAAIESILRVELDGLYIFEGPAGPPLNDDVPDTDFHDGEIHKRLVPHTQRTRESRYHFRRNRWRTDGRKRDEMLQAVKRDWPGPTWGVVIDADEVLVNGEFLRDRLQSLVWDDEAKGADRNDPENPPWARCPLHLIEHDGSMSIITARVFRCDLLSSIDISSSVVTNAHGIREGWGNYAARSALWMERWLAAVEQGKMIAWPPLPCEPHIVHRSNLRHPARRALRMSAQETIEFAKAKERE